MAKDLLGSLCHIQSDCYYQQQSTGTILIVQLLNVELQAFSTGVLLYGSKKPQSNVNKVPYCVAVRFT